jgi:hypothetical protein
LTYYPVPKTGGSPKNESPQLVESMRRGMSMRFRAGRYATFLSMLVANPCVAQDQSNVPLQTCTLSACGPEFVLFIRVADGSEPSVLPDVTIVADGRTERPEHVN